MFENTMKIILYFSEVRSRLFTDDNLKFKRSFVTSRLLYVSKLH